MKRKWNVCGRAVLALAIAAVVAVQTAPRGFALAGRQEESGAPLPLSDPENSKHWKFDETFRMNLTAKRWTSKNGSPSPLPGPASGAGRTIRWRWAGAACT